MAGKGGKRLKSGIGLARKRSPCGVSFKEDRRDGSSPTWDWSACGMTLRRAALPLTCFGELSFEVEELWRVRILLPSILFGRIWSGIPTCSFVSFP